jgi:hypothetical protein
MKKQFDNLLDYLKTLEIRGCITGSSMLGYMERQKQDVDVFCYDEKSFTELYFELYHNKMFTILDKLEKWKSDMFRKKNEFGNKHHTGVQTIKFTFNTCIELNIILKKNCSNAFSVLASFDLDLICKAYCLQSKQYLDLSGDSSITKIASWNKWNPNFQSTEIWAVNRILRQLERCFKYHKRGYNTDGVVLKYIELINGLQEYQSIFSSENFNEKLKISQENTLIVKQICELWLSSHEITEEQIALLQIKIKEI